MSYLLKNLKHIRQSFKRSFIVKYISNFQDMHITDIAAMLTYYLVFSFFPLALAALSLLSLFGIANEILDVLIPVLNQSLPEEISDTILEPLYSFAQSPSASIALIFAIISALWASTKYLAGFGRANDLIRGHEPAKSVLIHRIKMLVFTIVLIALLIVMTFFLIISANFIELVNQYIPSLSAIFTILNTIRIPILLIGLMVVLAIIYLITPTSFTFSSVKERVFIPGAILAVIIIVLVTIALQFYLDTSSKFASIYGTIAGLIITLLWFWLINVGILMGALLNYQLEQEMDEVHQ